MKKKLIIINSIIAFLTICLVALSLFSSPHVKEVTLIENSASLHDQIKIVFSRPMNQDVTSQSFSIQPKIDGNFSWVQNTLFFTPKKSFSYGQKYVVSLTTKAQDIYGNHLGHPFEKAITLKDYSYMYISNDHTLLVGSMSGNETRITPHQKVEKFTMNPQSHVIAYIAHGKGLDDYEMYMIPDPKNPVPKRIAQKYKDIRAMSVTPDGEFIYFMASVPIQKRKGSVPGSFVITNLRLYVYDVKKDRVDEVKLPSSLPFFYTYSLTPEGQAFLLVDDYGKYYLRSRHTEAQTLLGTFGDYGGGTRAGDILVMTNHLSDDSNGIFLYDGKVRQVSQDGDTTALPSISGDGSLVSYSYIDKKFAKTPQKTTYNIKVVDVKNGKTVFDKKTESKDFSTSAFSPDGKYLTVEIHHGNKNPDIVIYPIKDEPYFDGKVTTILYDLQTGKQMTREIDGYNVIWME